MSQPPPDADRWQLYPGAARPVGPLAPQDRLAANTRKGYSAEDPLVIGADLGWKDDVWTVPPHLALHGDVATMKLDFRRAEVASQVIQIQVYGAAGGILLVVPEGWAAQLDRVTQGWGTYWSQIAKTPVGESPLLVLSGSVGTGHLRIRYPTKRDERRLHRQLAREQRQDRKELR